MKVLILGIDGYIGFPLAIHLLKQGHDVAGVDNFYRRIRVRLIGSDSLTPIKDAEAREEYLRSCGKFFNSFTLNLHQDVKDLKHLLYLLQPDAIVHLAEQPSAPYSMIDSHHAISTQTENVAGTLNLLWAIKESCPEAHLIKIGTMGEYGTPNCDIPEGVITEGPMAGLLFPRTAGSFYHLSKVHDTHNIHFACRNWGLRSTDIMQGVVFGLNNDQELTRFDYDEYFGTVINRFCVQSIIGHSLTVYGKGDQIRGFIPLKDSIQCIDIILNNPPKDGEYRTFNQFENIYSVNDLADIVVAESSKLGRSPQIENLDNPRNEAERHYYNPAHQNLFNLGYVPTVDIESEISKLMHQLIPFQYRIITKVIMPNTKWR